MTLNIISKYLDHRKTSRSAATYSSLLNISLEGMPLLTERNWTEWRAVLLDVLAPYKGAVDILVGRIDNESKSYSRQTDIELMSIIHRLVSPEMRSHVRYFLREEKTNRGSCIYRHLRQYCKASQGQKKQEDEIRAEMFEIKQGQSESLLCYVERFGKIVFRAQECSLHRDDVIFSSEKALLKSFVKGLRQEYQDVASQREGSRQEDISTDWKQMYGYIRKKTDPEDA